MLSFHATLHARPDSAIERGPIDVGGRMLATLAVPADAVAASFAIDFESASAALARLERMFVEPDGSFVWVASSGTPVWQVDGQLFDRAGRLLFVDLKGSCPAERLDELLSAVGWPATPVMFQLARQAVFVSNQEFRRFATDT